MNIERPDKTEKLEPLADSFYDSFYKKTWNGDEELLRSISIGDAYDVQNLVAEKRIKSGERVAGFKVGCTSEAIRKQFGLTEPISGRLFYPHTTESLRSINCSDFINCAIEPEMVLKMGKNLEDKNPSDKELIDAIEYVSPGIEIHEFNFWVQPPTIQELICSGGIHTGLVIGEEKVAPESLKFKHEIFSVYKDNALVTGAPASEIMGGPIHSLRWLVNSLLERGSILEKGSFVIPGSPVELVSIDKDLELKVVIEDVGTVAINFGRN
ncbi:MAG: hypothetical protein JXQ96_02495 [Cyclobacteriaceae bacterium]